MPRRRLSARGGCAGSASVPSNGCGVRWCTANGSAFPQPGCRHEPAFGLTARSQNTQSPAKENSGRNDMLGLGSNRETRTNRSALGKAVAGLAGLCLALAAGTASAQTADAVLFNGKILTVDKDFS